MDRQYSGFFGTPFSFGNILGPFTKGSEGNIVEFTVLLATCCFFCSMNHRCLISKHPSSVKDVADITC
jgi:hypothetical protein